MNRFPSLPFSRVRSRTEPLSRGAAGGAEVIRDVELGRGVGTGTGDAGRERAQRKGPVSVLSCCHQGLFCRRYSLSFVPARVVLSPVPPSVTIGVCWCPARLAALGPGTFGCAAPAAGDRDEICAQKEIINNRLLLLLCFSFSARGFWHNAKVG